MQVERRADTLTKLLLHACCGPCSLEPVRLLREEGFTLSLFYANSNIHPESEYLHRRDTLAAWARLEGIPVIEGPYDAEAWRKAVGDASSWGYDHHERCRRCYRLRLEQTACYAAEHGFDAIGSTLTVSPYQFTDTIGEELQKAADARELQTVFRDFRPYYPQATALSRELGMYRQNYCGCAFSDAEAENERAERKQQRAQEKEKRRAKRAARSTREQDERRKKNEQRAAWDAKQHAKRLARNTAREARRAEESQNEDGNR